MNNSTSEADSLIIGRATRSLFLLVRVTVEILLRWVPTGFLCHPLLTMFHSQTSRPCIYTTEQSTEEEESRKANQKSFKGVDFLCSNSFPSRPSAQNPLAPPHLSTKLVPLPTTEAKTKKCLAGRRLHRPILLMEVGSVVLLYKVSYKAILVSLLQEKITYKAVGKAQEGVK